MTTEAEKRAHYYNAPQRLHKYPISERAKQIVHKSLAIDTLFSGVIPHQWTKPDALEFHDEMDKIMAAGFKAIARCPSADAADTSLSNSIKSLEVCLGKINKRPDKYQLVRTTQDIDNAVAENKLGIYSTYQGSGLFEGDVETVWVFRQLGYGFHTG